MIWFALYVVKNRPPKKHDIDSSLVVLLHFTLDKFFDLVKRSTLHYGLYTKTRWQSFLVFTGLVKLSIRLVKKYSERNRQYTHVSQMYVNAYMCRLKRVEQTLTSCFDYPFNRHSKSKIFDIFLWLIHQWNTLCLFFLIHLQCRSCNWTVYTAY